MKMKLEDVTAHCERVFTENGFEFEKYEDVEQTIYPRLDYRLRHAGLPQQFTQVKIDFKHLESLLTNDMQTNFEDDSYVSCSIDFDFTRTEQKCPYFGLFDQFYSALGMLIKMKNELLRKGWGFSYSRDSTGKTHSFFTRYGNNLRNVEQFVKTVRRYIEKR